MVENKSETIIVKKPPHRKSLSYQLFPPWDLSTWRAVDDTLRGGASTSRLQYWWRDGYGNQAVQFDGHVDTTVLGNAGFASQRREFSSPLSLPASRVSGLRLMVHPISRAPHEPSTFTLTLKTQRPTGDPSPRSQVTFEAAFEAPVPSGRNDPLHTVPINLPFTSFIPTYRGRIVEPTDPRWIEFDPSEIFELGIMCRSGFGTQSGRFALIIFSVELIPTSIILCILHSAIRLLRSWQERIIYRQWIHRAKQNLGINQ